jgi:hypothetical protein
MLLFHKTSSRLEEQAIFPPFGVQPRERNSGKATAPNCGPRTTDDAFVVVKEAQSGEELWGIPANINAREAAILLPKTWMRVYPNPSQAESRIELRRSHAEAGVLEIMSLSGQRLAHWDILEIEAADCQRDWAGKRPNGQRISAGVYVLRYRSSSGQVSQRLVLR